MKTAKEQKNQQRINTVIFLVVIALVIANSIFFYSRLDLTSTKVFSISDVTKELVQNAEDTIYIDYYISPKLKTATDGPQQMIDILQEYQARSNGNVVFSEKNTDDADVLTEAGDHLLQQQQIQVVEENQATYAIVYSGIVIHYQDRKKVIPFFLEPTAIEYQVTSKIKELLDDDSVVMGLLILDDTYKQEGTLSSLRQVFEGEHSLQEVAIDTAIPEEIDALFVMGAKNITNDTAYYIDQFVMSGKGVYFAADTVNMQLREVIIGNSQYTLLHKMLAHYGVKIKNTVVADDLNKLIPVGGGGGIRTLQQYPLWITVVPENVNPDSPITSRFAGLDLYWTSPLEIVANNKYFTTLVSSSDKSWIVSGTPVSKNDEDKDSDDDSEDAPQTYQFTPVGSRPWEFKTNQEEVKKHSVTESYLGPLTSAVEAGIIKKPDGVDDEYKASATVSRFVVTGSSYFASYLTRISNATYNLVFISNAMSWLSSDEELLKIKIRSVKDYRLSKIADPEKRNALILVVQTWNLAIVPLGIIIFAVVVLLIRRRQLQRKH